MTAHMGVSECPTAQNAKMIFKGLVRKREKSIVMCFVTPYSSVFILLYHVYFVLY